ncbi:unnamed protein product [Rhizoctonia solani]|uniref:Protein kinase domain-containing protein n=1 Tax=Rhizoctonia solani TaxID=456999 RepID=A0A8H3H0M6_9AGAM|nr:unnamed protein product [Rhizoctonia solani]
MTFVHILDTDLLNFLVDTEEVIPSFTSSAEGFPTPFVDTREEELGAQQDEETHPPSLLEGPWEITSHLASEAVDIWSIVSDFEDSRLSEPAMPVDTIWSDPRPEDPGPNLDQDATPDTITRAMSAHDILQALISHGCHDVSKDLDISHVAMYCATLSTGNRVGIKCIRILVDSTEEGKNYLKHAAHELYVWSKCKHPSILELSGVAIFWQFLPKSQVNRCTLCVKVADGVEYLHKNGIVHGDLRPENILIAKDHTPKITDFGSAFLSEYTLEFSRSTTTQNMTVRWMAPEILNGDTKATPAGDIFALGIIIFGVITEKVSYSGTREAVILGNIMAGRMPSRPETHIPIGIEQADRLWTLLTSCWTHKPQERPDAQEVKGVMEEINPEGLLESRD